MGMTKKNWITEGFLPYEDWDLYDYAVPIDIVMLVDKNEDFEKFVERRHNNLKLILAFKYLNE